MRYDHCRQTWWRRCFFFLCGAARALGDLAQKGSNCRVLSRNCRQMAFVVHLKGLPTVTIRHLLHVKSMQTLSTCSRVLFSLFLVCSSMCFILDVHCYTSCNVKRTREATTKQLFHQVHGNAAMAIVREINFKYGRYWPKDYFNEL